MTAVVVEAVRWPLLDDLMHRDASAPDPLFFAEMATFHIAAKDAPMMALTLTITAEVELADPPTAHKALANSALCRGKIVLVERGECTFVQKYERIAKTGAVAIVIANTDESHPDAVFSPSGSLTKQKSYPPCMMISFSTYKRLRTLGYTHMKLQRLRIQHLPLFASSTLSKIAHACASSNDHSCLADVISELKRRPGLNVAAVLDEKEPDRGSTSVHAAVETKSEKCVAVLLEAGAHPDGVKDDGYTPLHMAVERDLHEIASLLISFGAYVDYPHPLGWTALHFAAKTGTERMLLLLIESGASISAPANDGCSPMHIACLFDQATAVSTLIAHGAELNQETKNGKTPYDFACRTDSHRAKSVILSFMSRSQVADTEDPVKHEATDLDAPSSPTSPSLPSTPLWAPNVQFFDEFLMFTRSSRAFRALSPDECGCKCVMPTVMITELQLQGIITRDERIVLNDTPSNRNLIVEGARRAAYEIHESCHQGFPPEVDFVIVPTDMRREIWQAMMTPVDDDLRQEGLNDDLIEQALNTARDQEVESNEYLSTERPSICSTLTSQRFQIGSSVRSHVARSASMRVDVMRSKFDELSEGSGMQRCYDILGGFLAISETHEYKQGLDTLIAPVLRVFEDNIQALRFTICLIESFHNGYFRVRSFDALRKPLQQLASCMKYWDPQLWIHMMHMCVWPELYAIPWAVTLLADVLSIEQVLWAWDMIIGLPPSFAAALFASLVTHFRKDLLTCREMTDMLLFVSGLNNGETYIDVSQVCTRALFMFLNTPPSLFYKDSHSVVDPETTALCMIGGAEEGETQEDGLQVSRSIPEVTLEQLLALPPPVVVIDLNDYDNETHLHTFRPTILHRSKVVDVAHIQARKWRGLSTYLQTLTLEKLATHPFPIQAPKQARRYLNQPIICAHSSKDKAKEIAACLVLCKYPCVCVLDDLLVASESSVRDSTALFHSVGSADLM